VNIPSSRRTARLAAVAVVCAGALLTTTALALSGAAPHPKGEIFVRF
jgi:hypothetical protein